MSVATELTRIQTAKADIKASIEAKGVTIPSDALINQYADYVDEIQTGGGGGQAEEDLKNLIEGDIVTLNIPNGTTKIRDSAFDTCTGLTNITIPDSVTSIGYEAFNYCTGLTSITIPNSVTSIGKYAFSGCSSLTSITIPSSVTSIGLGAFRDCTHLNSVVLNGGGVIGGTGFYDAGAFSYCNSLTSLTIGNSVTTIGSKTFNNCSRLTSVTIPDSVTSIGFGAFESCSGLTSVTIGNGITNIDQQAFVSCSSLTSVTIEATTPPTLGANALVGTNANLIIYVPAESLEAYKTATNWSSLADRIQAIPTE